MGAAMGGKLGPERRGLQRAAATEEQGFAHPRLEHRQGAADGGLAEAKKRRAFGHATGVNHRGQLHEVAFVQLHTRMLCRLSELSCENAGDCRNIRS
jgi:hypothetical protein